MTEAIQPPAGTSGATATASATQYLDLDLIPEDLRNPLTEAPQLRTLPATRLRQLRIAVLAAVGLFLVVPLIAMLVFSVRFPLTGAWTPQAWTAIFSGAQTSGNEIDISILWEGLQNTLILAALTVVLMLALMMPTMMIVRLRSPRMHRIVEFISLLPLTIPAIVLVVGLGPIYRFIGASFSTQSVWLVFAYVVLVLPFAYRSLDAGFAVIDLRTLVEAARSLGASWFTVLFRVVAPNMRAAIWSAGFISIAVVFGEYTIAALLNRSNLQTALFFLGQSDSMISTAMSLLTLLLGVVLLLALDYIVNRSGRTRRAVAKDPSNG